MRKPKLREANTFVQGLRARKWQSRNSHLLACCSVIDQPLIVLFIHPIFKKRQLPKDVHLNLRENIKLEGILEIAFADTVLWLWNWGYMWLGDKAWLGSGLEVVVPALHV